MKRYERNMKALSPEENDKLKHFKVCVIGCGGLGGYIIESLGRIGIGFITAVDGDVFEESNLNRQLLSSEDVLGISKAETAKLRMQSVNSYVKVNAVVEYVTENNSEEILKDHDLVVDALDNIKTRFAIEKAAQKLGIPLIHGAIAGWYGQVSVILPGKPLYEKIYNEDTNKGIETELGNLPFTAATIASVQAAEAVKVLLGRKDILSGKILAIDLLSQEYEIFEI